MKKCKKGFTLIELVIVILVLGIIAAIAIPATIGAIKNAEKTTAETNVLSIATAVKTVLDLAESPSTLIDRIRIPSGPGFENSDAGKEIEKAVMNAIDKKLKNKFSVNIELQNTDKGQRFSFTIYYHKDGLTSKTTEGYYYKDGKVTYEEFDMSILFPDSVS